MKEIKVDRALSHIRVLDLTDEQGQFCSKLLAELGADVIKVEPPGGDKVRSKEPLLQNTADSENGLLWFAYNTNKRSITLDIKREEGRRILDPTIANFRQ